MKTLTFYSLLLFLFSSTLFSQYASLYVQHPQQTWRIGMGTIEELNIVASPKGIYMQYDLYMTFSARGNYFSSADSIEVQLNFDLPKGSIVNDLWLWVGNDIMRALILDRWTASSIYESIVKRRRDPALLTKVGNDSYQLRVYPMAGTGTRKVKLSYLVPTDWTSKSVLSRLPSWIYRASRNWPASVSLIYLPTVNWNTPQISEFPNLSFSSFTDSTFGQWLRCNIPSNAMSSATLNLAVTAPLKNGVYLSRYNTPSEGIYQLALLPSASLDLQTQKKIVFLFDYDPVKTTISKTEMLSSVQALLNQSFTAADSFNLVITQNKILRASQQWIKADAHGIAQAFASIGSNPISDTSNLPLLLTNAIEFIKANGSEGHIILLAASDRIGDYRVANSLLNDLQKVFIPKVTMHITDVVNKNYNYYWINNKYYYGNDYFYENLAKLTNGTTQTNRNNYLQTLSIMLTTVVQTLRGNIESFDLYTKLGAGFCYGRFSTASSGVQVSSVDKPLLQVGKFQGDLPFIVEFAGMYGGKAVQKRVIVEAKDIETADSLLKTIWTGNYITALEALPASNTTNKAIVKASFQQRILSKLTAFLALEPSDTISVCTSCSTGSGGPVSSVESKESTVAKDSLVQAYPNPFNSSSTVRVRLPKGTQGGENTLKIYNMLGQAVRTFDPSRLSESRYEQFIWDGKNDTGSTVASGVYYFVLTTSKGRYTVKLIMMK